MNSSAYFDKWEVWIWKKLWSSKDRRSSQFEKQKSKTWYQDLSKQEKMVVIFSQDQSCYHDPFSWHDSVVRKVPKKKKKKRYLSITVSPEKQENKEQGENQKSEKKRKKFKNGMVYEG